jgi:hypothetical protein
MLQKSKVSLSEVRGKVYDISYKGKSVRSVPSPSDFSSELLASELTTSSLAVIFRRQ